MSLCLWCLFFGWCKPAAEGVFGADARLDELEEVVAAAGFGADAGETESAEGLPADQRAGDATVQIEIADPKLATSLLQMRRRAAEPRRSVEYTPTSRQLKQPGVFCKNCSLTPNSANYDPWEEQQRQSESHRDADCRAGDSRFQSRRGRQTAATQLMGWRSHESR